MSRLQEMSQIIVDMREPAVCAALDKSGITYTRENMDIGDFLVKTDDVAILIERKSVADLLASVSDGRYKDQKTRMLAWSTQEKENRLAYIIETHGVTFHSINSVVTGCILNSALRDGISVFCVKDVAETATLVAEISKRIGTYSSKKEQNPIYQLQANVRRKDNLGGPRECLVRQLCQIPGISCKKAESVVDASGSTCMFALIKWLEADPKKLTKVAGIGPKLCETLLVQLTADFFSSARSSVDKINGGEPL